MSFPPVPPRPYDQINQPGGPPPLPPLPPNFLAPERSYNYESPPHFADPLVAPRPHRLDPELPANMARNLDEQIQRQNYGFTSPPPTLGANLTPGFNMQRGPSPLPNPQGAPWSSTPDPSRNFYHGPPTPNPGYGGYTPTPPQSYQDNLINSMNNLSFSNPQQHPHRRAGSVPAVQPPPAAKQDTGVPSLTAALPTIQMLTNALPSIQSPAHDPSLKIAWCRDVFFLVDREQHNSSTDAPVGPVRIMDPQLLRLSQVAVPLVLQIASPQPMPSPLPPYVAEAIFHRATFAASGGYPDFVRHSPRLAFRDFEQAARGGYSAAWFRLGRDYENFNDLPHAKDCFERGLKLGVESCAYRMGMAHLMGQLGLPPSPENAVPLLHRAATLASLDVPQPAYVFGLLLLAEFAHVTIPPYLFSPCITAGATPTSESRRHLERAAYLHFGPAQYKLGHAYEFAQPPFPFDALLSVQYYSLASQQGEVEADMALSKWFLCGAEGAFEKDESLALTFAEKAARKGLPSAEFAMGYYSEVGVGTPKDVTLAMTWYKKATEHGNTDASERLRVLSQPQAQVLSRQEHDTITENKLVRKRTQAQDRSRINANAGMVAPATIAPQGPTDGRRVIEVVRKNSLAQRPLQQQQQQPPNPQQLQQRLQTMPEHSTPPPNANPSNPYGATPNANPGNPYGPPPNTNPSNPYGATPNANPGNPYGPPPNANPSNPYASPPNSNPGNSYARPQPPAGRQYPNQHRYTLSDAPSPPSASPRTQSPATSRPPLPVSQSTSGLPQREPEDQPFTPPGRTATAAGKGPATFAEMGFVGVKADEKDCVIM